ncbi:MAG: hypothetical protein K6G44_04285 [Lentisphaeria bacterium]|jgi:DNA-binding transcriptional regulator/RsmH inhibitor MraZ|nr:hypothetical protein [Lentisphaeria bacterium]
MKSFQGTTLIKLDSSCRLKLPPNVVADFKSVDPTGNVVLRYLPEEAVAMWPANNVDPPEPSILKSKDYFNNPLLRMRLRSMMQLTEEDTISAQGRLTLSKNLLDRLKLQKGDEVALIGMLNGYEIWKRETLQAEIDKQNEQDRRQYEQARTQYHQMGETSSE